MDVPTPRPLRSPRESLGGDILLPRLVDIFRLHAFISTTEQQHDRRIDLAKTDSVAWALIDAKLLRSIVHAVAVSKIAKTDPIQPDSNLCASYR